MSQRLFYICGLVGIIVAAGLGYYFEHFSLGTIIISVVGTAVVIFGIGQWRKKHVLK
jgi:uncharacterized membrane protein YeaQ/YmgE (transglycosylase-associated protein family)